jgi:nucleoside-diphosphate-sugar epimerase
MGRRLVARLLHEGHAVTLLNRGQKADPFGDRIGRLRCDRSDPAALAQVLAGTSWDLVYDMVCYTPDEAAAAAAILDGRVGRLVVASTIMVHEPAAARVTSLAEDDFRAGSYPARLEQPWREPAYRAPRYGEGKRQMEAVLGRAFRRTPVAVARIAHVLAPEDEHTGRLAFHSGRIRRGEPIGVPASARRTSFVTADDMARFLAWAGEASFTGPVNAASEGGLSVAELAEALGEALGRAPVRLDPAGAASPFGFPGEYTLDTTRARALGFTFTPVESWLPDLARAHVAAG